MFPATHRSPPFIQNRNALLFLAALTLLVGLAFQNAYILSLSGVYIVVLILAWRHVHGMFDTILIEREHYPRTFEGATVHARLRVRTERKRPIHLLEIEDTFPPAATERIRHLARAPFDASRPYEIHYAKRCVRCRGPYLIGPARLRASDPFGLFLQTHTAPVFTRLLVYPQAVELPALRVLGRGTLYHVGQETTSRAGQSEEFIRLRDYRPGDPPAHIHWPSSARHDRLIIKRFQETVVTEATLFIDLSRVSRTGLGDQTSTEWIVRCAASMATRAIELSHLVQVFAVGQEVEHMPLGGGYQHLIAILDRMALYRAEGRASFARQVGERAGVVKPGATVVVCAGATSLDLASIEKTIAAWADIGARVLIALVEERDFIKLIREQDALHHDAAPIEEIAARLERAGARVYPVRADSDLPRVFNDFERE